MKKIKVFVLLGRLSGGLSISKVMPIAISEHVEKVYVFSNVEHFQHEKVKFILLPVFLNESNKLKKIVRYFYEFFQLFFRTLQYRPHLINGVFTYPKGYNAFIVSKLLGKKCMISIIGNRNEINAYVKYTTLFKKINIFIYKHSRIVTTKGDFISKNLLDEGVDPKRIYTFNGSIDTERFKPLNYKRKFDLVFVGYFSDNKGPDRFVQIVNMLSKDFENIKAIMIGEGPLLNKTKKMVENYNLTKNIEFVGYVNSVENYFSQSKILIMPSFTEGLSTAMLEAMSCGCIPIVSDVGAMSEAVKNDFTGYLVKKYDDINSYVESCRSILNSNELQSVISANGIKLVNEQYSIEAQSQVFNKIIQERNII